MPDAEGSSLKGTYTYNALGQLTERVLSNMTPSGTVHSIYDRFGNLIAEADGTSGDTVREYLWLTETPFLDDQTGPAAAVPLAVVADVDTMSLQLWFVHGDHLNRPVKMTDAAKASVWDAVWLPYGGAHSISGSASNDARFPGQWFQIESGLAYNWHRHYDATTGRYSQADPLGFADGPSLYAYAVNSPQMYVDPDGRQIARPGTLPLPPIAIPGTPENENWTRWATGKIRDFGNVCRRAVGFGGGGDEPEEDCHGRYAREEQRCYSQRRDFAHPHFLGGCLDRAAERRRQCVQNSGRPNPAEPREWSSADEEIWRNFGR